MVKLVLVWVRLITNLSSQYGKMLVRPGSTHWIIPALNELIQNSWINSCSKWIELRWINSLFYKMNCEFPIHFPFIFLSNKESHLLTFFWNFENCWERGIKILKIFIKDEWGLFGNFWWTHSSMYHEESKYLEMAFRVNEYNNVVYCFLIAKLLISRNF